MSCFIKKMHKMSTTIVSNKLPDNWRKIKADKNEQRIQELDQDLQMAEDKIVNVSF